MAGEMVMTRDDRRRWVVAGLRRVYGAYRSQEAAERRRRQVEASQRPRRAA